MAGKIFDVRKEYWYHVSNQNEIPIYGNVSKSINTSLLYNIAQEFSKNGKDKNALKQLISNNPDSLDTLRTIVGVTDKRMYLELSYVFNKHRKNKNSDENILKESVYSLQKHRVNYFKSLLRPQCQICNDALDIIVNYINERGVLSILNVLSNMKKKEVSTLVDYLLLPKEIQQEETKRRGHGAEQQLAKLLHNLHVSFIPDKRHSNPMSQDDPNVNKYTFKEQPRNEKETWSMDLIIKDENNLRVFIQGLIHSSDPGQYGVNKSGETVLVKDNLKKYNQKHPAPAKELWGLVDGVGFVENPDKTIFKMIDQFDTFVQLKSLYKAGLRLHKLGLVKIKAIKFDMSFYTKAEADDMFDLYGSPDIKKITDNLNPTDDAIPAGKAWLYI